MKNIKKGNRDREGDKEKERRIKEEEKEEEKEEDRKEEEATVNKANKQKKENEKG